MSANRIVLSGYYGFDNIGDEAVLYSIVNLLKKEIPNVQITVLSNNPEKTKSTYGVESVNRWDLKAIIKAIKQSDLLVSGGGSLLQDVTSSKTVPYYLAIVKIAQLLKKKVVFYSQGIGPVNKGFSRFLIKHIVNKVDGIFVREPASKALLEEIGIKKEIHVAIDPVIGIECKNNKQVVSGKSVGVYLRPWHDKAHDEKLLQGLSEGLKLLAQNGYKLYLIPMHYDQDREIAFEIEKVLTTGKDCISKEAVVVVDKMLSIEEVLNYTNSFDMVIGMRLHSLIMAAATKVPMIGLSYDPKVTAFMKEMGIPYCVDTNRVSEEQFKNMVKELMDKQEEQKAYLEKAYEIKKEKVYLPVNYIKGL